MFMRRGMDKIFVVQAIVYLVTLFLSVNLLVVQIASSADTVVNNHVGIAGER